MEWLLIIMVLALVAGPVAWLRPSPQDKRLTALRASAREQGLEVRIGVLPQCRRDKVRKQAEELGAGYGLRVDRELSEHWRRQIWLRGGDGGWESVDAKTAPGPALLDSLKALPASAVALEIGQGRLICHWRERGGEQEVKAIDAALRGLIQVLSTQSP